MNSFIPDLVIFITFKFKLLKNNMKIDKIIRDNKENFLISLFELDL